MKKASPSGEAAALAENFCRDNAQTAFLLKRMKAHDTYIYEHAARCGYYALLLAQGLGFSSEEQEIIYRSALLQDIGKLQTTHGGVTDRQDAETVTDLLRHPLYSVEVLKSLIVRGMIDGEAILQHHENLDGTGYPFQLTWAEISLNARILHVADSFAAMTLHDRRNNRTSGVDQALEELYRWSDIFYDADLVALMFGHFGAETKPAAKIPLRLISH
jgi:HD-GYP domain-containing protein (c-di-GMP phosphodiesterase class II)